MVHLIYKYVPPKIPDQLKSSRRRARSLQRPYFKEQEEEAEEEFTRNLHTAMSAGGGGDNCGRKRWRETRSWSALGLGQRVQGEAVRRVQNIVLEQIP